VFEEQQQQLGVEELGRRLLLNQSFFNTGTREELEPTLTHSFVRWLSTKVFCGSD